MVPYIDPGTGSMLFTILIGLLGTGKYLSRSILSKLRFLLTGGIGEKNTDQGILPYVIFTDSKRYWNTFESICDEFEKRGEDLHYMTMSPDDPALLKDYKYVKCSFIGEGNRAYAKLNTLKADIVLSSTPGLDVYQWKRSKDVKWYAHVLHMANDATSYRMFGIDYYDELFLSGAFQAEQIRKLEGLRQLPAKELSIVGLPYMDALSRRLKEAGPLIDHETTVLLAPSWGSSSLLNRYGTDIIKAALDTGYHVIIRPHPQSFVSEKELMKSMMEQFPESDQLEWNEDNDNFEVLRRSDIMISDFSGVIFDFCFVFQKPVIYADISFDKAPYDAYWLDEEMWTFNVLPRIGKQLDPNNMGRLKDVIDELMVDSTYREGLEAVRREAIPEKEESAVLIVDSLIQKRKELYSEELHRD